MAVFNNSTKKTTEEKRVGAEGNLSIVAEGMTLVGDIMSEGDLRVEGTILGNLVCKSKLVVGKKGNVEGNVDAANATIEGRVQGTVVVRNLLQLQETGRVQGDILTEKMVVQSGAVFTGNCRMGKEASDKLKNLPIPNVLGNKTRPAATPSNGESLNKLEAVKAN